MRIIPTAILLIITLLIVPVVSYYSGAALGPLAKQALLAVIMIAAAAMIFCFGVAELTGNVSQVDKLWSILPIVYSWVVASYGEFSSRLVVMSLLVTLWGLRLSYNFGKKGGYRWRFWQGEEDYRWEVLRNKPEFQSRWKWTLFNLCFISGYQNVLVLLITLPMIVALQFNQQMMGPGDFVATLLMLFFIGYETLADKQHWEFQSKKLAAIRAGEELLPTDRKGFLDQGLWAWSRHPNYFAEQAVWICFYCFSVAASGQWLNWSITGSLLLMILFAGSSKFSEEISAAKYPDYAEYQRRVPRFVPLGRWN
jgi:steroid 5-alpha reductase family enzyme